MGQRMRTIAILTSQLRLGPGAVHKYWTGAGRHLEEEAEGDPLVVLVVSPLQRVVGLVHAGVRHLQPGLLPERAEE